ncbi:MAG: hypothetical protein EOP04_00020 [Proteobacteria bacterium]|nr:MAG: hypothetical protein EOP04_00020 [Pseudomonadota bacterium]
MKKLMSLLLMILVSACAGAKAESENTVDGGVDVGNAHVANVPQTYVSLSYPGTWSTTESTDVLTISNTSGSRIEASRARFSESIPPSLSSVETLMREKYPQRLYKSLIIKGSPAIRADLVDTAEGKESDIYVLTNDDGLIHIHSDLKAIEDGISEGEEVIATVQVKFVGVPYINQKKTTVILGSPIVGKNRSQYSFYKNCYVGTNECYGAASVAYSAPRWNAELELSIKQGRIVELGPDSEVPFDSIRITGSFLEAPSSRVPLADIYTVFTPQDPKAERNTATLKEGYVYLIRTVNYPFEDSIAKVRVDKIDYKFAAALTYENLVYVEKEKLESTASAANAGKESQTEGEITLYSYSIWKNVAYATFSFLTGRGGEHMLSSEVSRLGLVNDERTGNLVFGEISSGTKTIDLGLKPLSEVSNTDFSDTELQLLNRTSDAEVITGHTYMVYSNSKYGPNAAAMPGDIHGVLKVLEVDTDEGSVKFKFKRLN